MEARRRIAVVLLAVTAGLLSARDAAAQVIRREYAIKAGVLGVLAKCVTWPAHAAPGRGEPLKIGILGQDPFLENGINQLDRLASEEKRKGGNLVVQRFDSAADYESCHVLFISNLAAAGSAEATVEERMRAALELTKGSAVLVVGEAEGLASGGASANLLFDPATNLIRLEINPDAAARAGLQLAPDLLRLKLVRIVRDPAR